MKEIFLDLLLTSPDDLIENMKRIESLIRSSKEYKTYLAYLHEVHEMKSCCYFPDKNFDEVTLEYHHFPFTLYDLVIIIGSKYIADHPDEEIFTFDIAREVIKVHLSNQVSGIMLSKTIHELYHSGQYEIPTDSKSLNLGEYRTFFNIYKDYLDEKDKEIFEKYGAEFGPDMEE